jgi:hypothetical protein
MSRLDQPEIGAGACQRTLTDLLEVDAGSNHRDSPLEVLVAPSTTRVAFAVPDESITGFRRCKTQAYRSAPEAG